MTLIEELKEYLKVKNYTLSRVAKAVNLSNATLHLWMNNNYKGNVKKIEDAISKFLEIEKFGIEISYEIMSDKIGISIPVYKVVEILGDLINNAVEDIFEIAKTCHVENEIGVCCGNAGLGKTFAVKKYAIEHHDVILIEADLGYSPRVLFSEIHKKLGFDGCGTIHTMFTNIIDKLMYSNRLIIIDEAEHLPYKSLELLRRIYDKAQVGILLVGMPRLIMNLQGEKKQYAQLYSRVGIVTNLKPLLEEDEIAIISSVIPNYHSIYPIISRHCSGNTRAMTKLLARVFRISEINGLKTDERIVESAISQIIV